MTLVKKFGTPIDFEWIDHDLLLLFRDPSSFGSSLVLCSRNFSNEKRLIASPLALSFSYDFTRDRIVCIERNISDWLVSGDRDASFRDPRNRLAEYDSNGVLADVMRDGSNHLFYPAALVAEGNGNLVYSDLASESIHVMKSSGKIVRSLNVGTRFVRWLKVSNNSTVYFSTASQDRFYKWKTADRSDSIFKVRADGSYCRIYSDPIFRVPTEQINSFEPDTEGIFIISTRFLMKADFEGFRMFTIQNPPPGFLDGPRNKLFLVKRMKPLDHMLCTLSGFKEFSIHKLVL